jgi:hypothetical protein
MLFIDGTWLYYSLHERKENQCPIIRKFGRGWQKYYKFDWYVLSALLITGAHVSSHKSVFSKHEESASLSFVASSCLSSFSNLFYRAALPRIICEQMQIQQTDQVRFIDSLAKSIVGLNFRNGRNGLVETQKPLRLYVQGWSTTDSDSVSRPVEIVRASVFTSYRKDTNPSSHRVRMYEEMKDANYDVHMMETLGKGEKCVDIQIAVEMLHYATVPNAYDVAILLR